MSLARVYTSKKVRKDWTCEKCHSPIRKGIDGRISFAVGFRGFERTRCLRPECYPTPSERESSALANIYAVQEGLEFGQANSKEDFDNLVQEVADVANEVADDYESSEMFEVNEDLQERAQIVRDAAEALDDWDDGLDDEPTEDDEDSWGDYDNFEQAHESWRDDAVEAAQSAVNDMELP